MTKAERERVRRHAAVLALPVDDTPTEQSDREAALRRWRGLDELGQPLPREG